MAHILVVDDDELFRDFAAGALKSAGHRVTMAGSARVAVDFVESDAPDLVVTDINMPDVDGFQLVEILNAPSGRRWIPVILMSAMSDTEAFKTAFRAGAVDYLVKPFKRSDIIEAVGRKLAEAANRRKSVLEAGRARTLESLIPNFSIISELGEGGMGAVYLAERNSDKSRIALKLLTLAEDGVDQTAAISRFLEERAMLARIDHPSVAKVYEHGISDTHIYIAMEYFPCGDLRDAISMGVSVASAIRFARQIAEGLEVVHAHQIVHRDIKPANIMLRSDGSVALVDFGIAKSADAPSTLTSHGETMGTPHYMSPEQINGDALDARADLYSVGALFYEMLTRRKPFAGERIETILMQHVSAERPQLPRGLSIVQPIIERLMAVDPDDRFPDARSFLRSLEVIEMMRFSTDLEPTDKSFLGVVGLDTLSGN